MRTGDLVFWKGDQILESMVAELYGYSHVSLVLQFDGIKELFLVEALAGGLKLRNLAERVKKFDIWEVGYRNTGEVYYYGLSSISKTQRRKIERFVLYELTRDIEYDSKSFVEFLLMNRETHLEPSKYTCAEFVWASWIAGGLVPPEKKVPLAKEMMERVKGELHLLDSREVYK